MPSHLDEKLLFPHTTFLVKVHVFWCGVGGGKMGKQVANICKLSETKNPQPAKSCLYLPSQWTNWSKFYCCPRALMFVGNPAQHPHVVNGDKPAVLCPCGLNSWCRSMRENPVNHSISRAKFVNFQMACFHQRQ